MQYEIDQIFRVIESGGPNKSWQYAQAHIKVLKAFDPEEQATVFMEQELFNPESDQSMECQFVVWLSQQNFLQFIAEPDSDWNVSNTLSACHA